MFLEENHGSLQNVLKNSYLLRITFSSFALL